MIMNQHEEKDDDEGWIPLGEKEEDGEQGKKQGGDVKRQNLLPSALPVSYIGDDETELEETISKNNNKKKNNKQKNLLPSALPVSYDGDDESGIADETELEETSSKNNNKKKNNKQKNLLPSALPVSYNDNDDRDDDDDDESKDEEIEEQHNDLDDANDSKNDNNDNQNTKENDELYQKYIDAKEKANSIQTKDVDIGKTTFSLREIQHLNKNEIEDGDEEEQEYAASTKSSEFVYVKKTIQQFLNRRVLKLERTNYSLQVELDSCVDCIENVSGRLAQQQKAHALSILNQIFETKRLQNLYKAFNKIKYVPLCEHAIKKRIHQAKKHKEEIEEAKHQGKVSQEQSQIIAQLRAENRRLQLELEDRSRAAELLCKRLLRVDATARSSKR